MSEPSEAAKAKACELANAAKGEALWEPEYIGRPGKTLITAFARFIQEVSDAAKEVRSNYGQESVAAADLAPFILPEPKPTPVEVLDEIIRKRFQWHNAGARVVEELAQHGLEIRESGT